MTTTQQQLANDLQSAFGVGSARAIDAAAAIDAHVRAVMAERDGTACQGIIPNDGPTPQMGTSGGTGRSSGMPASECCTANDMATPGVRPEVASNPVVGMSTLTEGPAEYRPGCQCARCYAYSLSALSAYERFTRQKMHLCPICGNKRCPKSTAHWQRCSGSNDSGQVGSGYGVDAPPELGRDGRLPATATGDPEAAAPLPPHGIRAGYERREGEPADNRGGDGMPLGPQSGGTIGERLAREAMYCGISEAGIVCGDRHYRVSAGSGETGAAVAERLRPVVAALIDKGVGEEREAIKKRVLEEREGWRREEGAAVDQTATARAMGITGIVRETGREVG